MNQPTPTPENPRQHRQKEYDDPHYHDEELDVQRDDLRRKPGAPAQRGKAPRRPPLPPRRQFEE
jgi:hypothetical protein